MKRVYDLEINLSRSMNDLLKVYQSSAHSGTAYTGIGHKISELSGLLPFADKLNMACIAYSDNIDAIYSIPMIFDTTIVISLVGNPVAIVREKGGTKRIEFERSIQAGKAICFNNDYSDPLNLDISLPANEHSAVLIVNAKSINISKGTNFNEFLF